MSRKGAVFALFIALMFFSSPLFSQKESKGGWEKLDYATEFYPVEEVDMPALSGGEVKLPWKAFAKILKEVIVKGAGLKKKPPVGYTVDSAFYSCSAGDEEATVKAKMKVWIFDRGYTAVPIFRGDIAVETAKFSGAKAALAHHNGWISAIAEGPATFTIEVSGRTKVSTDHGMKVIRLDVPEAGSGTIACDIGMKNASVKLQPGVITKKTDVDKGLKVEAGLFPLGYIDLRWWEEVQIPEEDKKKEKPRLYAEVNTLLSIGEGLVLGNTAVDYSIIQGDVEEFKIIIPDGVTINNVTGTELKDWTVEEADSARLLRAFLSYKVSGSYTLNINYEKSMGKTSAVVKVPEFKVLDVERETGFFGIAARTNVEISADEFSGTTQIDPREACHYVISSSPRPVLLAYKYLKHPFEIVLDVKKHFDVPVLIAAIDLADVQSVVTQEGKYLTRAVYLVRNNMKQFLKVKLPKDSSVWSTYVGGKPVKPGKDDKGRILVPLENSSKGPGEMTSFAVEIVYLTRIPEMKKKGKADLYLLEADLPVSHLQWSLYLPKDFKYKKFDGNVQKAAGAFKALPQEKLAVKQIDFSSMSQGLLQSNVMNIPNLQPQQVKAQGMELGVMPVKMEIPQQGKVYRFTKMLVIEEKPKVTFKYKEKWFK